MEIDMFIGMNWNSHFRLKEVVCNYVFLAIISLQ